jgi:hypothetical protein
LLFRLQTSHGADDTVTGIQTEPSLAFITDHLFSPKNCKAVRQHSLALAHGYCSLPQ